MEWVETTGRTVEEAKDAALDELGVDEQDAEFVIVEEPRVGLFGRLRSEARVRARVRPTRPRAKEEHRRDRRKRRGEGDRPDEESTRPTRDGEDARGRAGDEPGARSERGERRGRGERRAREQHAEQPQASAPSAPRSSRSKNGRPRSEPEAERGKAVELDVPLNEQADVARTFLVGLLDAIGARAEVEIRDIDEETVEVGVVGGDLGALIGPRGATLGALQDVTRTVVQRRTSARNGRLIVDVAGYRQKRREALERFVQELAATVKETGERKVLEPMNPADRKVVHDTVNNIDGVGTVSEGEEPRRRVVIVPQPEG